MTDSDWKKVEELWDRPYTVIKFEADGYNLTLQPCIFKMKLARAVYINGCLKGEWIGKDCEERRRFFRPRFSFCFSKKYRDAMLKIYGKREYNKRKDEFEKKQTTYYPDWSSFRAFKKHLSANNKDIKLITD